MATLAEWKKDLRRNKTTRELVFPSSEEEFRVEVDGHVLTRILGLELDILATLGERSVSLFDVVQEGGEHVDEIFVGFHNHGLVEIFEGPNYELRYRLSQKARDAEYYMNRYGMFGTGGAKCPISNRI